MVVGSKGPAVPTGPESPAGPIPTLRVSEERESREGLPGGPEQVLPDQVPGAGDLVHVAVPVLEHPAVRGFDVIEDGAHAPPHRGEPLAGVHHGEVHALAAFDEDPILTEVQVVELAVLPVDECVADELLNGRQHSPQDVLVLVLGQAAREVVDEESIAVDEEDFLHLHSPSANEEDRREQAEGYAPRTDVEARDRGVATGTVWAT